MLGGMTTPVTPDTILADNIAASRVRRRLQQQDLADRMRVLGWKWVRQTVGEVENSRRRVTPGELLGVAACLDTTVQDLLSPRPQDGPVVFPSGVSLTYGQVRSLLDGVGLKDEDFPGTSIRGARDLRGIRWRDNTLIRADESAATGEDKHLAQEGGS
jgi:transcriptional regulator with XRE-family HTH domain